MQQNQMLTEKENLYIQDAMDHEELCILKYNQYAQQVNCPQLQQLLQQISAAEVQHLQTLQGFKTGQNTNPPSQSGQNGMTMGGPFSSGSMSMGGQSGSGSMSMGMSGSPGGQKGKSGKSAQANASQTMSGGQSMSSFDEMAVRDLLTLEKTTSGLYSHAVLESSMPQLRQALTHIEQEEQQHAFQLFQYAQTQGWYAPQ